MSEDNDYEGLEDEWSGDVDDLDDPCEHCGPWCSDWGGDGLCIVAIKEQTRQAAEYRRRHVRTRMCPVCKKQLTRFNVLAKEVFEWSPEWYDPMICLFEVYSALWVPKGVIHSKYGTLFHIWIGEGENRQEKLIRLISEDKQRGCKA